MSKFGPKGPHKTPHGFKRYRPSPAELRAAVLAIPKDTRDITGQLAGDPLPERSALSQKQRLEAAAEIVRRGNEYVKGWVLIEDPDDRSRDIVLGVDRKQAVKE